MTIFCNVNKNKLDLFVEQIQSGRFNRQPALQERTRSIFKSEETPLKAVACAQFLIQWQNNLDEQTTDPSCKILFDATAFEQFSQSQRALNKLKRKFSRLVIQDMPLDQQESLLKESTDKLKVRFTNVSVLQHLFQFQGEDAICLEMLGLYANHRLKLPHRPMKELVALYGDANYQHDAHVVLAVASTVEHVPFSSNTWGFPGQVSWPSAAFTEEKASAVVQRRVEFSSKSPPVIGKTTPWSKVVPATRFANIIHNSKYMDGSPVGNCGERSMRIFRQLAKQRRFDCFARLYLNPGDHWFNSHIGAGRSQLAFADAWNGAKIYPEKYLKALLKDYLGINFENGKPYIQPYNENAQKILLDSYNIYPLVVFKSSSKTKHPFLCALLEEFHQIPGEKRKEKMLKALEIIRMIEHRMPLYEYIDPAVNELYDQMMYLTKKERKNGLKYSPPNGTPQCLINEALQNLDLNALRAHINDGEMADGLTILHAIKAALRADDIRFLKEVVDAGVPIEKNTFTAYFHHDADKAIQQLASELSSAANMPDLALYCNQALNKLS